MSANATLRETLKWGHEWKARALKYEQALREICKLVEANEWRSVNEECWIIARAALDKPGGILQTPDVQCIPRPE